MSVARPTSTPVRTIQTSWTGCANARIWVTTSYLIWSLDLSVSADQHQAAMGETILVTRRQRNDIGPDSNLDSVAYPTPVWSCGSAGVLARARQRVRHQARPHDVENDELAAWKQRRDEGV